VKKHLEFNRRTGRIHGFTDLGSGKWFPSCPLNYINISVLVPASLARMRRDRNVR